MNRKQDREIWKQIKFYSEDEYQAFKKVCKDNDVTVTRALNLIARETVQRKRLPVEV